MFNILKSAAVVLLLPLVLTGCATRTGKTDHFKSSARQATAMEETLAQHQLVPLKLNPTNYFVLVWGQKIEIKERDLKQAFDELPQSIRMRPLLASAMENEWKTLLSEAGRDTSAPVDWTNNTVALLQCFQASDGVEFLADHSGMDMWYRVGKGVWICALSGINVVKTFGGAMAHLPLCYAGSKRFLVAETLPGKEIESNAAFPKRHCATLLIDCERGRVIARTRAIVYDHNPFLVMPKTWKDLYGIEIGQEPPPARQ